MFCGMCGTELSNDALFCPVCGEPVEVIEEDGGIIGPGQPEPAAPFMPEQKRRCKSCGEELEDDDMFCGNCGAPVKAERPTPPVSPVPPTPPVSPVPPTPPAHKAGIDPLERHELVIVTRAELASGCQKAVEIDGKVVVVDIPPYYDTNESMYFKGYGYEDKDTGRKGDLKVDFMVN